MKNIRIAKGTNVYDWFITPTVRVSIGSGVTYITIEWLKWYFGIALE